MSIGKNIKRLRSKYGLTQEELGAIADVSSMAVSQWENDRAVPRMGAVQAIADHFKISKSEIIDDEKDNHKIRTNVQGMAMGSVPLLGSVHAGKPQDPDTYDGETVKIPQFLIDSDPECYALEAEGDCMNKVYPEGCTIAVSPNKEPTNGSVAVVSIDGSEAVMRRMYRTPNTLVLSPDSFNPDHDDIVVTSETEHTIEFLGKVVWFQAREEME